MKDLRLSGATTNSKNRNSFVKIILFYIILYFSFMNMYSA
jgi:hypothetical protein